MTTDLHAEAEKMRRVPGIIFADTPSGGRVARIAGTGLEVFELIFEYRLMGENWNRLTTAFHWLNHDQLRAALNYAATYPEEINPLVEALETFSLEDAWEKYPFMKPKE
jgi:uncharacterized protein (DUF433 family)